jgi:cobalamin biosynthesis protein CobW
MPHRPSISPDEGRLARAQLAGGDLIVLNKIDLVDAETLARVHAWIGSIRPGVWVFATTQSRLPMEILLGTGPMIPRRVDVAADAEAAVHDHDVSTITGAQTHEHDRETHLLFDTWTYTSDVPRPPRRAGARSSRLSLR